MKKELLNLKHLTKLCRYMEDRRKGEMIETKDYMKTHLGFGSISSSELDQLCDIANKYLCIPNEEYVHWSMGEIFFSIAKLTVAASSNKEVR